MSGAQAKILGRWGEQQAAEYLRKKGYRITAAGFQTRFGEVDLIAENRRDLLFVEVKLRRSASFAQAREFVDRRKQERLRITAELYLQQNPTKKQPRFDVIEIYAPNGMEGPITIEQIENAF